MLIAIPAFIILSIWIINDINNLESRTEKSISLPAPVTFLYNSGGYWVTVAATPLLSLVITILSFNQFSKIKKESLFKQIAAFTNQATGIV